MFNAAFLRVAREAIGFTQAETADRSGIDQAEISRWERGLREPSSDQIKALAGVLEFAPRLLVEETAIAVPVHRSARVESKRVQRRANGRLELARIAAERVLADIDIDSPFRFPTLAEPGPTDPEDAAESVRRVWRIPDGPLPGLSAYLEAAGATVLSVDFGTEAIIAAYTQLAGNRRWFFLNTRSEDAARGRFSVAHELGHAILHWDRFDAPVASDAERDAHLFAASLLMPRHDISAELAASSMALSELIQIGERWGVSPQALVMRAASLDLIGPSKKPRLFAQLNARGLLRSGISSIERETPRLFADALTLQRVENGYTDEELAEAIGLPLDRLRDLLPDYFAPDAGPRLRLIETAGARRL
jgi:Zn-dependent peptidase ImmA (M78 family)/DNA-binding XRE family transcriptional regulator